MRDGESKLRYALRCLRDAHRSPSVKVARRPMFVLTGIAVVVSLFLSGWPDAVRGVFVVATYYFVMLCGWAACRAEADHES